ncbi:MAG: zinc ribbon domain-containing protein [Pyrobaculum sp.]
MKVYRTLLVRRRVGEIPPEQLVQFIKVQEEFRRWATEWYRKTPMPEGNLKYFAKELKYALKLLPTNGLKNGVWRVPLPFDAQLRLHPQCRDQSRGVLVDLSRGEIRIRKWGGGTIEIRLRKSEIKWIRQRLEEGGQLKLAYAWIGHTRQTNLVAFNLALVFARETEQYHPIRIMAIDLNALHNGVSWGVVDGERVIRRDTERPDLVRVGKLQKEISRLDSLCAEDYCEKAREAKSRLWRLLRRFEDEAAKRLVELAIKQKAAIVVDAPEDESVRELMEGNYTPNRKIYLNIGRLRRRIRELAEWYGVPYREERLYSTVCPRCESRMEELPNRKVKCQRCGFKAPRDKIPLLWAVRRFSELIQPPSFSPSPLLIPVS